MLGALLSSQTKDQVNNGKFCAVKETVISLFYFTVKLSAFTSFMIIHAYLLFRRFQHAAAIHRLHQNGFLTPEAVDKADESTIRELIYPVCYPSVVLLLHIIASDMRCANFNASFLKKKKRVGNKERSVRLYIKEKGLILSKILVTNLQFAFTFRLDFIQGRQHI